ncbi:MAG TPA: hypothetical protein VFB31_03380 [Pseudolabrys sp.]|nr:hypothetical protein [Pseudolabrys sp.]
MRYVFALIVAVLWSGAAFGQHAHGDQKGPNGGPMHDVAGVHAELLISGNTLIINIFDEGNKPVATAGFSASALVVLGTERETLTLVPSGGNAFKGELKRPAAKGGTITITLKTVGGKSGQARFKL